MDDNKKELVDHANVLPEFMIDNEVSPEFLKPCEQSFEIIYSTLLQHKNAAFDYYPDKESKFGIVLALIDIRTKLTLYFERLHPSQHRFLYVSFQQRGGFSFILNKEKIHLDYFCKKLSISKVEGKGILELINYLKILL